MITHKIAGHSGHEIAEGPEGDRIILEDRVKWTEKVRHALHIPKILRIGIAGVGMSGCRWGVIFKVGKQHVLELFQVDIRTGSIVLVERR